MTTLVASLAVTLSLGAPTQVTFESSRITFQLDNPAGIAATDLDGDQRIDVVVSEQNTGRLELYFGSPNGFLINFLSNELVAPGAIVHGDFDGQNGTDLAVVDARDGAISIFYNQGNGAFTRRAFDAGLIGGADLDAGDIDGDGDLDIAATNFDTGSFVAFFNAGFGIFEEVLIGGGLGATAIAICDLNGDPQADIIGGILATANAQPDRALAFLATRIGRFASNSFDPGGAGVVGAECGDLDNDGDDDVLLMALNGTIRAFENMGLHSAMLREQGSSQPSTSPGEIRLEDLNLDGILDIIVTDAEAATVHVGIRRDFGFGPVAFETISNRAGGIALDVADFGGDNLPDIFSTSIRNGSATLLENKSTIPELVVSALDGAWIALEQPGQGLTFDYLESLDRIFVAWFTFDAVGNKVGAEGQRWLTADLGINESRTAAVGNIFATSGGAFTAASPEPETVSVGSMSLTMNGCDEIIIRFSLSDEADGEFSMIPLEAAVSNDFECAP